MVTRYIQGWATFWRQYRMQRRKKHGAGKQAVIPAIYFAQCGRWIVYGQYYKHRTPNIKVYYWLARKLGQAT